MAKMTRLTPEERENLVAYLDGELEEAASHEIEVKLAESQTARHDVEMLSRTWEMLNLLPQTQVTEEFTRKTITLVQMEEVPAASITDQPWFRTARRILILTGWSTGMIAASVLGFQITNDWVPSEARQLVEDLPVIENLEQYQEVGSIEFLKELKKSGLFNEATESPAP